MKANVFFLLFLISLHANASSLSELRDLYDTTFSRDNSYCSYNQSRFELQIRSIDRYSQPNDRDYGEFPFIVSKGIRYKITNFNKNIGRFRFIYSKEQECSKTLAIPLNKEEITLFYALDSRPHPDTLILVHFNPQKAKARIINTELPIKEYYEVGDKLYFSSYIPKANMSTIDFDGHQYTLLQSVLPQWKIYHQNKITNDLTQTFNQFEWKNYFQDLNEFKKHFEWNKKTQSFNKEHFEIIFNYQLKKRCLKVLHEWRCRAI
ncbi:MAG: hypothetical protein WCY48_03870 [Candidatus Caldatribacteriota bacterium]